MIKPPGKSESRQNDSIPFQNRHRQFRLPGYSDCSHREARRAVAAPESQVNTTADGQYMQGVNLKYGFAITTMGNMLCTVFGIGPEVNEQAKALAEGCLAGMANLLGEPASPPWAGTGPAPSRTFPS
jgi:hypothetical protein